MMTNNVAFFPLNKVNWTAILLFWTSFPFKQGQLTQECCIFAAFSLLTSYFEPEWTSFSLFSPPFEGNSTAISLISQGTKLFCLFGPVDKEINQHLTLFQLHFPYLPTFFKWNPILTAYFKRIHPIWPTGKGKQTAFARIDWYRSLRSLSFLFPTDLFIWYPKRLIKRSAPVDLKSDSFTRVRNENKLYRSLRSLLFWLIKSDTPKSLSKEAHTHAIW